MIAVLLKELLLQKPENLEILTLTPAIMEVETYRMLKLTHLGGETIFHFHDYCGRKSHFIWKTLEQNSGFVGLQVLRPSVMRQPVDWSFNSSPGMIRRSKKTSQNKFNPPSSSKRHLDHIVSLLMMQQTIERSQLQVF